MESRRAPHSEEEQVVLGGGLEVSNAIGALTSQRARADNAAIGEVETDDLAAGVVHDELVIADADAVRGGGRRRKPQGRLEGQARQGEDPQEPGLAHEQPLPLAGHQSVLGQLHTAESVGSEVCSNFKGDS